MNPTDTPRMTRSARTLLACALLLAAAAGCSRAASRGTGGDDPPTAATSPDTEVARRKNAEAVDLIGRRKYEEAERVLREAVNADLAFGPAHNSLGKVYFHQGKLYQAAWEFQYAAKLMPYQPEPRNNLGLVFEQVGKLDEAVGWYERATALEPDNPQLIGNLARAKIRRGDHGEDVRGLLTDLVAKDTREEWITWARERLVFLRLSDKQHTTVP